MKYKYTDYRLGLASNIKPVSYTHLPYVLAVISLLIISGGLGFLVWQDLSAYHRTHHLRTHTKLVLWITGWLLLLGTAGILFMEYNLSLIHISPFSSGSHCPRTLVQ